MSFQRADAERGAYGIAIDAREPERPPRGLSLLAALDGYSDRSWDRMLLLS